MVNSKDAPVAKAATPPRAWLTVSLWAVLIALSCLVYSIEAEAPTALGIGFVVGSLITLVIVIAVIVFVLAMRRHRSALGDLNRGCELLSHGRLDEALVIFRRWSEQRSLLVVAANARHNAAWTLMRQGKHSAAIELAADNIFTHERSLHTVALLSTSLVDVSLFFALLGKLDDAEAWFVRAEETGRARSSSAFSAMKTFTRAVIDCRAGRTDEAARLLDEEWARCESTLTGSELRPLRVINAFAHSSAGPRSSGVIELGLSARPAYRGEYDFLGVDWPEMQAFLTVHHLDSASAPASASASASVR